MNRQQISSAVALQSPWDLFEDHQFRNYGLEPHFGLGLLPSDFNSDRIVPRAFDQLLPTGFRRHWALARQDANELVKDYKNQYFNKDGFQASVDVHHFKPSEITVKAVDNQIVVEGKHEEHDDGYGSIQRHFVRKYQLPKEYDMKDIQSSLSSDGILMLKAHPQAAAPGGERHVPITLTIMPARLSLKDGKDDKAHHDAKSDKK